MSKLKVYDKSGASVAEEEFPGELLELGKGEQAVHDVVVNLQANARAGTASTLRKGEVAGSNRKPWRQKGTGRARAGYRQSPVWRGGSVAFGPHPRAYGGKVNKKVAKLALRRALSEKVEAGDVWMIEELVLPEARTKVFAELLKTLGIAGPALFVADKIDPNTALASRNIPKVEVVRALDVNVYQLLRYPVVVVSRAGMESLKTRLK